MAQTPDQSLPQQNKEWGEWMGAYRFLNNSKTTPHQIQSTHRA
jgi:hypothetical protein